MSRSRNADDIKELLRRVGGGDRTAFSELYSATAAKLYGIILRITRDREAAEDILQDVFVRIWDRAGDFEPGRASPITWMATIARNRAIDEIRKRGRAIHVDDDVLAELPAPEKSALENVEANQSLRRLAVCLEGLEEKRREAVKLAYLEGWSREELAERFSIPTGTMKSWLRRSLQQLKDCLGR